MASVETKSCGGMCGCLIGILIFNLTIGAWLFDYCLWAYADKDIPWYGDVVCGMFLGEFAVPAALIACICNACGVPFPIFGGK